MTSTATLAESWATNSRVWVAGTILASLLVVVQELATPLPHAGWIAATLLLQAAISSVWGFAVSIASRSLYGRLVPVAAALMWGGIGVIRGIVGGFVASAAGVPPEWIYRIAFWILVSACWMPLLALGLTRWGDYRKLLAMRADLAASLTATARRAAESADERTRRMSRAIDDALSPALAEIRVALRDNVALDESDIAAVAVRLDELARRTAEFSASSAPPDLPPARRVSVREASLEFELRRPVLASLLGAAAASPLVVPEAFRTGGWDRLAEVVVAIAVSTALLVGVFTRLTAPRMTPARRSLVLRIGVVLSGVAGAVVLLVLPWQTSGEIVEAVAFPLIFATAASASATIVALSAANVELTSRVGEEREALGWFTEQAARAEAETATRLETLVRGEVNGRVAGCALALGMLADGEAPEADRSRVIAGVLRQLDAAAADLAGS